MKAVHVTAHGPPEVLQLADVPDPVAGPGEVLVRVRGVSVNHLDLWVRRGMPGVEIPLPRVPGCDGTGEVAALGEGVEDLQVGQPVVLLPGFSSGRSAYDRAGSDHLSDDYGIRGEHSDGFCQELVALERRFVMPLPEGVDVLRAAAVPLVFLTAWGMLMTRAELRPEETVLVIGGASGVGSAAIQIAKDLGARVVTIAGTEDKRARARELGADEALDHHDPDWPRKVKRWSGGRGVDVVVEHVGPATWAGSMRALARNGRLVTCGGTTGPKVELLLPHLFIKNLSVLGSTMGPRSAFPTIFERVAAGAYRPVVDRVLPMSEVVEAHRALEAGEVLGKIVLEAGR
jgi:NADPH:quinone reductase-like Zn-dependent oxidoreductase